MKLVETNGKMTIFLAKMENDNMHGNKKGNILDTLDRCHRVMCSLFGGAGVDCGDSTRYRLVCKG